LSSVALPSPLWTRPPRRLGGVRPPRAGPPTQRLGSTVRRTRRSRSRLRERGLSGRSGRSFPCASAPLRPSARSARARRAHLRLRGRGTSRRGSSARHRRYVSVGVLKPSERLNFDRGAHDQPLQPDGVRWLAAIRPPILGSAESERGHPPPVSQPLERAVAGFRFVDSPRLPPRDERDDDCYEVHGSLVPH
jgi:hypothetical protein